MNTIFLTGASSGIGKATAVHFAQSGWNVIATMRSPEKDTELSSLANVRTMALDISDATRILEVVAEIVSTTQVDVVFNNAGHMLVGPLEVLKDQEIVEELTTNLLGPIRVTQAFIPHFREKRGGLFINTTSLSALVASPFTTVYAASKAGLERWSFAMSLELEQFGIKVKTIIPGVVKTKLFENAVKGPGGPYAERMDKLVSVLSDPKNLPFAVPPEDIAKIVFQAATDGTDQIRYLADPFAQSSVAGIIGLGEQTVQKVGTEQLFQ